MALTQGSVEAGAAITNTFAFAILAASGVIFTRFGELSSEGAGAQLPDDTATPTGRIPPVTTDCSILAHHDADVAKMEAWYVACTTGTPGHKQTGILSQLDAAGAPVRQWMCIGAICISRSIPEHDTSQDGDAAQLTYGLSIDRVTLLA